ncbi:hypothetical protein MAR_030201 [Mya arenaria]|uniref:Uncharacterized protein n=1 Tax=Mya arenaria TaxID=6604 RepID=A0ABY7DKP2_MYAAR|nr:hypothetical protein MAR_030201 [Mya arenaria]
MSVSQKELREIRIIADWNFRNGYRRTQSRDDQSVMEDTFPDLSGKNYHSLQDVLFEQYWARVIVKGTSGNLLSRTMLQEVSDINKQIQTISVTDDTGNNSKFSDLCVRAYDACAVDGSIFWDADFLTAVDHGTVSYPAFISTTVGSVNYASRLGVTFRGLPVRGAKSFDANSYLTKMEYIQLGYALRTDTGQKATVKKWVHYRCSVLTQSDVTPNGLQKLFDRLLVLLEAGDDSPKRGIDVADETPEPIVPGFTHVVGPGLVVQSGCVDVPSGWLEPWLSASEDEATGLRSDRSETIKQ